MGRRMKKVDERRSDGVFIRMDKDFLERIQIIAKREGKTQNETIKWLIEEGAEIHKLNNQTMLHSFSEGGEQSDLMKYNEIKNNLKKYSFFEYGSYSIRVGDLNKELLDLGLAKKLVKLRLLELVELAKTQGFKIVGGPS